MLSSGSVFKAFVAIKFEGIKILLQWKVVLSSDINTFCNQYHIDLRFGLLIYLWKRSNN